MSASAARRAALQVVTRVRERSAYAHETMDAVLGSSKLDRRDTAFATRLAYGTIAARGTLDAAVLRHVSRPESLEPQVADALAVTAYELLFMRTPARAAVSQGVELAKSVRGSAAGFANAVLRRLAEEADRFPWGDPETDDVALARLHGHPQWIADLWIRELGRDAAAKVMAADNEPAPLFLAPVSVSRADVVSALELAGAGPSDCALEHCVVVEDPISALSTALVRDRAVIVADAGAQFAAHAVPVGPSSTVVEIGAGRGTKSLLMAAEARRQGGSAEILALDLHSFKLEALSRDAAALGLSGITTLAEDALSGDLSIADESADAVLVDAPCSGLGTLRRHPDRRWRAKPEELQVLAALGGKMLETAARLVKPGGFLVYSTCTIASRENRDVVEAFLASSSGNGFTTDSLAGDVPEEWRRFVGPEGWFQSVPEPGGPDGHFVARLVRA